MYIVIGLGNPGGEYQNTRHNAGKLAVEFLEDRSLQNIKFAHIESYMNQSGASVAKAINGADSKKLVVIYDDIDLPLGTLRISYDRGSGGHNGVESIIKALKTREFIRIRIGIAQKNIFGKIKKPKGEEAVNKFILGEFKKSEKDVLEEVFKKVEEALKVLVDHGLTRAMTEFNK